MKNIFLYILACFMPLWVVAQATPPAYTIQVDPNECGGKITVDWTGASAQVVSDHRAVLYTSAGVRQAQQDFNATTKQAVFDNLSAGRYTVEVHKKDGTTGFGGTHNNIVVTSSYVRFSVDMSQVTETPASGQCSADGQMAIKIKDGSGPFLIRLYERGSTTPAATSAPTNKTGSLTTVNITGLKPQTTYDIEVTDQIGGGACSLTEPKNVRSKETARANTAMLRSLDFEIGRPKKSTEPAKVETGFITIGIDNTTTGPGPFTISIVDDNGVTFRNISVPKAAGATTTVEIVPTGTLKYLANMGYRVTVSDGTCTVNSLLRRNYGYSSRELRLHLVPRCNNCNEYDVAVSANYTHQGRVENYYPYMMQVRVQRAGNTVVTREFINEEALAKTVSGKYHVYGNNEFGFWNWWDPRIHKIDNTPLRVGDVITVTYRDANGVTLTKTHTVAAPKPPISQVDIETGATPCSKNVLFRTRFNYSDVPGVIYNAFCQMSNLSGRIQQGSSWTGAIAGSGRLFRYYDEINSNTHTLRATNQSANTYRVEYQNNGSFTGAASNTCRHFLSDQFTRATINGINPIKKIHHNVGGTPAHILEKPTTGNKLFLGSSDRDYEPLKYITANNKLTVRLDRLVGGVVSNGTVNVPVTGPWNLAGTYRITFPYIKQVWPEIYSGRTHIYQFTDLPIGQYRLTLQDQCGNTDVRTIDVGAVSNAFHELNTQVTTDCAQNGQNSKGKIRLWGSITKDVTANLWGMYVYKDLDNGNSRLHNRRGALVASGSLTQSDNLQNTSRYNYSGEISNLPPGKYLVAISTGIDMFSLLDRNTALNNGFTMDADGRPMPAVYMYKPFVIEEYKDIVPVIGIGMCDPSNPSTGLVRVEMPAGSEPQYPIKYTLYKVSGGTRAIATHSDGTQVVPITIATKPANLSDAFATFNNIPKLNAGESYEVTFESGCLDRVVPVPDFGTLTSPVVRSSVVSQCAGAPMTLSVDLPSSLYDITWHSSPASAIPTGTVTTGVSSITFNAVEDAEYWVSYSMKAAFNCGTTSRDTAHRQVNLTRSNFTTADISALVDVTATLPLNQCTANASWTAPTVNDAAGCGYKLTWSVLSPDGTTHTPPTDANGNSVGSSWNGFQMGESTVTYRVEGKIAGGTVGTRSFKVTVSAPNVNIDVNSSFVTTVGGAAVTQVSKGTTIYYKVTLKNTTSQQLSGGSLRITLPDNTNGNYELPQATDTSIVTTQLGTGVNVTYDAGDPRVLILGNIDGSVLTQNAERSAYIPIKIKNDRPCSDYDDACAAVLTGRASFTYQIGGACATSGTVNGTATAAAIDNSDCLREELLCQGGTLTLRVQGTGYNSYQWYSGGTTGASYSPLGSAATENVTTAGYYRVDKTTQCDGVSTTVSEIIKVVRSNDFSAEGDTIRRLAGGLGASCDSGGSQNNWVSHFYLCDGQSRTLAVSYYQATSVEWQRENAGCAPTTANCLNQTDGCWTTAQSGRNFTISAAGRYRLRVRNAGCTKDFYFEVFTDMTHAGSVTNIVNHTDLSQGGATVEMNTHNIQYKYKVTRLSDNVVLANNVLAVGPGGELHKFVVSGLAVPGTRTQDTFRIEVTPASGLAGCSWTTDVTINYIRQMQATVTFKENWSATLCNKGEYEFSIIGGRRGYKYLIYKIDGELYKSSYNDIENIPDTEYTVASAPTNPAGTPPDLLTEWIEVPREGRYIFLVKDADDRKAETNEIQIRQTSKYAVEVTTTGNPLSCATEPAGSIVAKFLDTTVPSPRVELKRYKSDGTLDGSWPAQTNQSGQFNNLGAGKYRVELSYLMSSVTGQRCTIVREVEITSPEAIEASVGVVKDISCSTRTPKVFELKVNWVKGGVPPYQYSTSSATAGYTTDTTLYSSGGSAADPKIKVYVRDSKGCIAEVEILAKQSLTEPSVVTTPVEYDCAGNGSFTVTPTTPAGTTYTYEYSIDGGARQAPSGPGNAMRYTGLTGKSAPYQVTIYYKEPSTTSINQLYKETFGDVERVGCSDAASGGVAPSILSCAELTGALGVGSYVITKQLPTSTEYASVTGTGRYYAARTALGGNLQLYVKDIKNVVARNSLNVKLRYINLGITSQTAASASLNIILEVKNPSGTGYTRFTKVLTGVAQGAGWSTGEVSFPELAGFMQGTATQGDEVRLIIEARSANTAVGLDDVEVTQPTIDCQAGKTVPVQVAPGRGFAATVTNVEVPKCQGGEGIVHVQLSNAEAGATYTYRLSASGADTPITLATGSTDRLEIPAGVGTHNIYVTMHRPAVPPQPATSCEVGAGTATVNDVPKLAIQGVTIREKGCTGNEYDGAGAVVEIVNGTGPYTVQYRKVSVTTFTDVTTGANHLTWDSTNSVATFDNLDDNSSYVFRVKDANGCLSLETTRYIPAKIDLTIAVQETLCLSPGETAVINVQVTNGNGGYEFSKDGGTTWVSDASNPTEYEFDGLAPGTYTIKVRDRLACEATQTIEIGGALEVTHTTDDAFDCSTAPEEHIEVLVKGGTVTPPGAYTFEWKRGGLATDALGYNPQSDNDGGNVTIVGPTAISADTYRYTITVKTQGMYHFKVTDGKGCVQTQSEEVVAQQPAFLSGVNLTGSQIACAGESDGVIGVFDGTNYLPITDAIDRTRGVAPYTVTLHHSNALGVEGALLPGNTGRGLAAGWYLVKITDAKGCTVSQAIQVTEVARPVATATKVNDVNCAGASGARQGGSIRISFTGAPQADYFVGLYTDSSHTALAINEKPTPENTGKTINNVTAVSELFDYLTEGNYYPAVVNLTTGCMTTLPMITIQGTNIRVTTAPTVISCEEYAVAIKIREDGSTTGIDETKVSYAIYRADQPLASQTWISTGGVVSGSGTTKEVTFTKRLLPRVPYRIAVRYNGCISTQDVPMINSTGAATFTSRRVPSLCGTGSNTAEIHYDVTGINTSATNASWTIYRYPADISVPMSAPVVDSGNVAVSSNAATINATVSSLVNGQTYVLVLRETGVTPQCILGSTTFTVSQSVTPLAMVSAQLSRNSSCATAPNASAAVTVAVQGGTGPYRYTISQSSTEPTVQQWGAAQVLRTNSRSAVIESTFDTTTSNRIEGATGSGTTWWVHVRDAQDCWVSQQVTVFKDETANITAVEVDNPCVEGNEYVVLVTMDRLGSGQHYYTFKSTAVGATESPRQPIDFQQTSTTPLKYEGRIYRVYGSATTREVRIYDQNGCVSNVVNLDFNGKVTFDVSQTKALSCLAGAAGNGEITVTNIANRRTGYNYLYRLVRVESQSSIDPITQEEIITEVDHIEIANTPLPAGTTTLTLPVSVEGRYRVDIIEQNRADCPYSRRLTIPEKVTPVMIVQNTVNSKCYNPLQSLSGAEGGSATLITSPESVAPVSYTLVGARYADDGSAVTLTVPATYQNVTATTADVDYANNGRRVTFKNLLGDIRGIVYTVRAKGNNDCENEVEFTIFGVREIKADMDQSQAVQFSCSGDEERQARLSLPLNAISGGSGSYRFSLIKAGVLVPGSSNLSEPNFAITDEDGGQYTLRIEDARSACAPVDIPFPADREIKPFVKVTSVQATEVQDITCQAGESVQVTVQLAPATVATDIILELRDPSGGAHSHTLSVTGTGSYTFTNVPVGNYSVRATNAATGCVVYGTAYRVQDPNTFGITATLDKPVKCHGGADGEITLTFSDTDLDNGDDSVTGFSYIIRSITDPSAAPITGVVPAGSATVVVNTLPYGAYYVEATSTATGCVTRIPANFSIRQADQPMYIVGAAEVPDDCSGTGTGEISVVVTGGIAPYKVTLTDGAGYSQTATGVYNRWLFTGVPGGAAPAGTNYTFTIEDAWGCTTATVSAPVNMVKPDPIDFTPVTDVKVSCVGKSDAEVEVTGVTGGSKDIPGGADTTYYYELFHSTLGAIRPLQTSAKFTDLPAGSYTLTVSDRWNCRKTQQFNILDPDPIRVTLTGNTSLLCYDTLGKVEVSVVGGTPTVTPPSTTPALIYTIEVVDKRTDTVVKTFERITASQFPYTVQGLSAEVNYVIRATDGKQCPGESNVFSLSSAPNLNVRATYEDSCQDNTYTGNIVITFDDATVDYSKLRYSFDGGATRHSFASGAGAGAEVRISSTHASVRPSSLPQVITLFYIDGSATCQGETNPLVIPVVEKLLVIKDPSYEPRLNELKVLGKNGVPEYTYYFNDRYQGSESLYVVTRQDPEGVDPSDNKLKKKIDVRAIDSKGCEATATYYMEYIDIEIPNYFTPNGDGENDTWAPRNTQQYPGIKTLIYDRYGRLLRELSQRETWDGTYNGKEMPTGDYWYIITLGDDYDGREFKGHFTLFR